MAMETERPLNDILSELEIVLSAMRSKLRRLETVDDSLNSMGAHVDQLEREITNGKHRGWRRGRR